MRFSYSSSGSAETERAAPGSIWARDAAGIAEETSPQTEIARTTLLETRKCMAAVLIIGAARLPVECATGWRFRSRVAGL